MAYCRSCKAEIIWAETENGKRVPLGAKPEKRFTLGEEVEGSWGDTRIATMQDTYISHFVTCPDANQHRKKK
jgi:hypothetical protein